MSLSTPLKLRTRTVYAGSTAGITVFHAVQVEHNECRVLLTDPEVDGQASGNIFRAFEAIATVIRQELVYLRAIRLPLRFFHARRNFAGKAESLWELKEVTGLLNGEQFVFARWLEAPDELKGPFIEALDLWDLQLGKPR